MVRALIKLMVLRDTCLGSENVNGSYNRHGNEDSDCSCKKSINRKGVCEDLLEADNVLIFYLKDDIMGVSLKMSPWAMHFCFVRLTML